MFPLSLSLQSSHFCVSVGLTIRVPPPAPPPLLRRTFCFSPQLSLSKSLQAAVNSVDSLKVATFWSNPLIHWSVLTNVCVIPGWYCSWTAIVKICESHISNSKQKLVSCYLATPLPPWTSLHAISHYNCRKHIHFRLKNMRILHREKWFCYDY